MLSNRKKLKSGIPDMSIRQFDTKSKLEKVNFRPLKKTVLDQTKSQLDIKAVTLNALWIGTEPK